MINQLSAMQQLSVLLFGRQTSLLEEREWGWGIGEDWLPVDLGIWSNQRPVDYTCSSHPTPVLWKALCDSSPVKMSNCTISHLQPHVKVWSGQLVMEPHASAPLWSVMMRSNLWHVPNVSMVLYYGATEVPNRRLTLSNVYSAYRFVAVKRWCH